MTTSTPRTTTALIFSFAEIPFEGLDLKTDVRFEDLYDPSDFKEPAIQALKASYTDPILITGRLLPVGSKLDVKGALATQFRGECSRCNQPASEEVQEDFSTFLMPDSQFSEYDKPGGKVIRPAHLSESDSKHHSRHHSRSKAPVLSDAEGEHEDTHFGAFDGEKIDLRKMIREHLLLDVPMTLLCSPECQGLCLECGEPVAGGCKCAKGPTPVEPETESVTGRTTFAELLKKKLNS